MTQPHYPPTEPRQIGDVIETEEFPYIAADNNTVKLAAFYGIAMQRSINDARDLLEPDLPPEARPYVEVFERFLLDRAEHYMKQWAVDPPTPAQDDVTPE